MARILPYAGTSHSRLSELIKNSQPKPLPDGVTFEFRNVVAPPSQTPGDTKATVTPILKGVPKVSQDIDYTRLSLDVIHELPEGEVLPLENIVYPTTLHEQLPYINYQLGLDLTPAEVENYQILTQPVRITVTILAGNLAWIPGPYYFNVDNVLPPGVRIAQTRAIRTTETGAIRVISPE